MAVPWIKIEHVTPDKPEIARMASILGIDQDAVFGKLLRFWIWLDQHSLEGNLDVTPAFIDRLVHFPGYADALIEVSWLKARNGALFVPNFSRHNGQTAKNRALNAARMKLARGVDVPSNLVIDTKTTHRPHKNNTRSTPEEELEEDKSSPPPAENDSSLREESLERFCAAAQEEFSSSQEEPNSSFSPAQDKKSVKKFVKPTVEEIAAYCRERGNDVDAEKFFDFYESKGWLIGKNPMKDWKAAVRTWEKNQRADVKGGSGGPRRKTYGTGQTPIRSGPKLY